MELPGVVVHSVYKPPDEQFLLPPLGIRNIPHIVIGDTPQLTKMGKRYNYGLNQTTYHSYTIRSCRNHSTVLYGRKSTTLMLYLHRQTFQISIQRPYHSDHPCLVNANQVAHQLLINGQGTIPTKRPILSPIQEGTPTMAHPFSEEEYRKGIVARKNKAVGRYDVLMY